MLFYARILTMAFLTMLITPLLAFMAAVLLLLNLVHRLAHLAVRGAPPEESGPAGPASIVILNWNGRDLLAEGLPSVLEAVQTDGHPHEILVVDNGSTDGSAEFLRKHFPDVRVLALHGNLGFAGGNNAGVRAARNNIVVLLNNDMIVDRGFLRPLLEGFGPKTFAVSSQIHLQDPDARREETGRTSAVFRRGMIDYEHRTLEDGRLPRPYYPVLWAGGGSSAFHRDRFLRLGGFAEIYSPAYVEDTDLSYRAWRAGYEVLFAPSSIVHHKHRASSNRRFSPADLNALIQRNQFLFIWKNIGSWRLVFAHCAFLPWNCYRLARDSGLIMWKGLLNACLRIPSLFRSRLSAAREEVRSDREIFRLLAKPGLYFSSGGFRGSGKQARTGAGRAEADRPRILWLTAYLPYTGRHAGAGRMYQLLKRIARSYRITLLSFMENEDEKAFLPDLESLCEEVVALRRTPAARYQLFPYEPFHEYSTPAMHAALQRALENRDFALLQLEYSQMACYADRSFKIPTLLTKHEVDFAACARRARVETNPFLKIRWFYNYLQVLDREIGLTRRVDAAICMTEPDRQELRKFCASVPLHVVNTGVDLDYFKPRTDGGLPSRLIFVGAFQHLPNVDAMVYFCREVLPMIRARIPAVQLSIVGSSPPPAVSSLGEIPGVRVTGYVPDIRPHMAESAVYVVPLRLGVGIRGKILEAWSMAMPVVATPVACAGLRYEEGKNVLVADAKDHFASQIVSLLGDASLRIRLGTEGRKTAEQYYGWDASARQLNDLYQKYMRRGTQTGHQECGESGARARMTSHSAV